MKKFIVFSVMCVLVGTTAAMAQDIDALVKKAVDKLVEGRANPVEASIAPLTVGETDAVSGLSAYLNNKITLFASNNSLYNVIPATRGLKLTATSRVRISGSYTVSGKKVGVELWLEAEIDGKKLAKTNFDLAAAELKKMGIEILPDNFKTQKDIEKEEIVFENIENNNAFALKVYGSSESRTYYDGDKLKLILLAEKNCFFKVYHIDVNKNMKMIYPNSIDTDNQLSANTERTIPEKTEFVMEAPYGEETILVVAGEAQFENLSSEMLQVVKLSKDTVEQATTRGLSVQAKTTPVTDISVNVRYTYTILRKKPNTETVIYDKPADFSSFLEMIKQNILAHGGTFSGNEKEGKFTESGLNGSYKVKGKEIIFDFESAVNEIGKTRGLGGSAYNFSFSKPYDINKSLKTVQSEITKNNGTFSGNESEGSFAVQGIAGGYKVSDNVSVSIYEKPWVVPNSIIEKEVKNYFLGK